MSFGLYVEYKLATQALCSEDPSSSREHAVKIRTNGNKSIVRIGSALKPAIHDWPAIASSIAALRASNHNAWGPSSLDTPVWIDSDTSLIDIIPEGQALWR